MGLNWFPSDLHLWEAPASDGSISCETPDLGEPCPYTSVPLQDKTRLHARASPELWCYPVLSEPPAGKVPQPPALSGFRSFPGTNGQAIL